MKSLIVKTSAAIALLGVSAVAMAANMDCCGGLECCLRMLACCF